MAQWWLRLRGLVMRDRSIREGRHGGRAAGKPAGKVSGMGEVARTDRPLSWAVSLGLALLVLHLFLFPPVPRLETDFPEAGQVAEREIRAEFPFEVPLPAHDIQMQENQIVLAVPPVLRRIQPGLAQRGDARMENMLIALGAALTDTVSTLDEKIGLLSLQLPTVRQEEIPRLLATAEPDSLVSWIRQAWSYVVGVGVVDRLPAVGTYDRVVILTENSETLRPRNEIIVQANLADALVPELVNLGMGPEEATHVASVMRPFISPNHIYDPEETRRRQDDARDQVAKVKRYITGERIIDEGVLVSDQDVVILEHLKEQLLARGGGDDGSGRLLRFLVRGLLVAVALVLFGWLALIHFPENLRRLRFLVALSVVVAVYLVGASFALGRPALGPLAVPVILLSLFATVLFRDRVGYTATLLGVSLLAFLPGVGPGSLFTWYILGMVTVVSVRRIQKRSQFYQAILLLTFLSVTLVFLLGPTAFGPEAGGNNLFLVSLFTPVLLVAFGLFLLPVIEPLVGVCSDLTLLELSDLNHPLLKRMALEAQGTYHHSQVVSQLAEHAARAIDANALLTRVGALFHDIGKMEKSEYYVENQRPEFNKHDELSPSMSALVIAAHVKDGMELGRKWRLPQMVIDFIPEHHGTLVMEYFYHKALESHSNETVKVDDFRYPGPKPRSRETAILMLADAIEAATRALGKPTPSRIREVTKQIIDKRMLSGELDDSGLTLSDLARIREAFIPLLTGIHHARIVYPGQKAQDSDKIPERRGDRKAGA
jgi:putative nucleotidyltransferase with HDIG domain